MIPRLVRLDLYDCCVAGARAATRACADGVATARIRARAAARAGAGAAPDGVTAAGSGARCLLRRRGPVRPRGITPG